MVCDLESYTCQFGPSYILLLSFICDIIMFMGTGDSIIAPLITHDDNEELSSRIEAMYNKSHQFRKLSSTTHARYMYAAKVLIKGVAFLEVTVKSG